MNILYIGTYRQNDGWGEESKGWVRSLKTLNINLATRPIYLGANVSSANLGDEFFELENKKYDNYDVIIQHVLPEYFHYHHGSKNIGLFLFETNNISFTPWISKTNLMDEIWVPNTINKLELERLGCTSPIFTLLEPIDTSEVEKDYIDLNPSGNFTFYTIGDGYRKNLEALLIAFHREFCRNEPVDLLIKTNRNENEIRNYIANLKQKLGMYNNINQYKQEMLSLAFISQKEIYDIHHTGDCFVMSSYGEGVCRPALESLGFGNTPIVTDGTGMVDYITNENGWLVKSYECPVFSPEKPLPYLYTSRETWRQIDILDLQRAMREAYENKELKEKKAKQGKIDYLKYSYHNIGQSIYKRLLNA